MAVRKLGAHINLQGNEVQNGVDQNLASAPSNPKEGQFYWNTSDKKDYVYNGTSWVDRTSQGKIYTAGTGIDITNDEISVDYPMSIGQRIIIGPDSYANGAESIAIGYESSASGDCSIQIGGGQSEVSGDNSIGIGNGARVSGDEAIMLGYGTNSDDYTFKVGFVSHGEYDMLDGTTGKIPNARINIDSTATENSTNAIQSGAMYTALAGKVTANNSITGATKCKITYDTKGLVTSGADLTASDIPDISDTYVAVSTKGQANGVASLDSDGKVPTAQLPSYVDDVVDAYIVSGATALSSGWLSATSGGSALTPETGKIYVVLSSGEYLNKTYRWSGTTYVEISASPAQATESQAGIAEIATQSEVNTGTNDTNFVTPLKLATYIGNKKTTFTNPALTASGGQVTWTISTTLAPDCIVTVRETSGGAEVYTDVTYGSGSITIKMNSASNISAGVYTAVVLG